jgi:hypothetical protein
LLVLYLNLNQRDDLLEGLIMRQQWWANPCVDYEFYSCFRCKWLCILWLNWNQQENSIIGMIYWSENDSKILDKLSPRIQWHFLCQVLRFISLIFWLNWIQCENLIEKVDHLELKVDNKSSKLLLFFVISEILCFCCG